MRRNALAALAAARAVGRRAATACWTSRCRALRGPADRAARRHRRRQRLLQRQPDVDARRPRRPRRVRVRAPRRRARRHARARARRGPLPRGDRRPRPRRAASTCSSPSARAPRTCADGSAARCIALRRRRGGRRGSSRACSSRATPCCQGLARRRPRSRRPRRWKAPDGRGPHRRHGRAAHLHLPVAEASSRSCATREFGQLIREEGPEGHHAKAGTPTMGGIIIFAAISVPFLILSDYDWRAVGVFGAAMACALLGFADDYTKIVKRRSLGPARRARSSLVTIAISLGLWWVGDPEGRAAATRCACASSTPDRPRRLLPAAHLPRRGGHDERGQPHRRPRRPRRAAARRSCCSPTSGSRSSPTGQRDLALLCGLPRRRLRRASCGSTPSRRRSSWATPGRSGWAARSPGSR